MEAQEDGSRGKKRPNALQPNIGLNRPPFKQRRISPESDPDLKLRTLRLRLHRIKSQAAPSLSRPKEKELRQEPSSISKDRFKVLQDRLKNSKSKRLKSANPTAALKIGPAKTDRAKSSDRVNLLRARLAKAKKGPVDVEPKSNVQVQVENLLDRDESRPPPPNDDSEPDLIPISRKKHSDGTEIFSLRGVEFSLRETGFKKPRQYLNEVQYETRVTKNSLKKITSLAIFLSILRIILSVILDKLRNLYPSELWRQVNMVFSDHETISGIHSGEFNLHGSENKIIQTCLAKLFNYLQSKKEIMLDETFKIQTRITSLRTAKERAENKRVFHDDGTLVGSKKIDIPPNILLEPSQKNCFQMPKGYPGKLDAFKNKCLIGTTIFAFYREQHRRHVLFPSALTSQNNRIFLQINRCHERGNHAQKLYRLIEKFCRVTGVPLEGPHSFTEVCPILADYFSCQIVVYSCLGSSRVFLTPGNFSRKLSTIYLCLWLDIKNMKVFHCLHIIHLHQFFARTGYDCPACGNRVGITHEKIHYCRHSSCKMCLTCLKPKLQPDTYTTKDSHKDFCKLSVESEVCKKCNLTVRSVACRSRHKKFCRRGFTCPECGEYIRNDNWRNNSFATFEELVENHVCHQVRCKYCYKLIENERIVDHQCQIDKGRLQTEWSNLLFFDFESIEDNVNSCVCCTKLEKKYKDEHNIFSKKDLLKLEVQGKLDVDVIRCEKHRGLSREETVHEPNFLVVNYESEKRGRFNRITFADSAMNHPKDCIIEENVYNHNYIPSKLGVIPLAGRAGRDEKDHSKALKLLSENIDKHKSVTEKLLDFLLCNEFQSYCCLAHNGSRYDNQLILRALLLRNIKPEVLQNGNSLIMMSLPLFGIRFLDSINYTSGSLDSLAKRYNMEISKLSFPFSFNKRANYDHVGSYPDASYYKTFRDSGEAYQAKVNLVNAKNAANEKFNFKDQIYKYTCTDTDILMKAMLRFIEDSFTFQEVLHQEFPVKVQSDCMRYLHPFTNHICTASSFIFSIFRFYALEPDTVYTIRGRFGPGFLQSSKQELIYSSYLCSKFSDLNCFHMRSQSIPVKLDHITPDFYAESDSKNKRIAAFFNGCYYHGHLDPKCPELSKGERAANNSNYDLQKYKMLNEKMDAQIQYLKNNYPNIKVEVMWACQFDRLLNAPIDSSFTEKEKIEARSIRRFMIDFDHEQFPQQRLQARDALKGGKTEVFRLHYNVEDNPDYDLFYMDYTSLYPSVGMMEPYASQFPVGKFKSLLGTQLNNLEANSEGYFFEEDDGSKEFVNGILQVRVFPPDNLWLPFLPYKFGDKTFYALCAFCVENSLTDVCTHTESERSWVQTYCSNEVNYALSLGYTFKVYEIFQYEKTAPIFKKILNILGSFKIKYSGFPNTAITDQQKHDYCAKINEANGYIDDRVKLTIENVKRQENLRQFYKDCLNKVLGKWSQDEKSNNKFVTTYRELEDIYYEPKNSVKEVFHIVNNVMQVKYETKEDYHRKNLKTNVVIGSFITSSARITMHKSMTDLMIKGGKLIYHDTDSIVFAFPKNQPLPLKIGENFSEYKHELGDDSTLLRISASGPKAYTIIYRKSDGSIKKDLKIKGFSLRGEIVEEQMFSEVMCQAVEAFVRDKTEKKSISQFHIVIDKKTKNLLSNISEKIFSNDIFTKRVALKLSGRNLYSTAPYGYRDYHGE